MKFNLNNYINNKVSLKEFLFFLLIFTIGSIYTFFIFTNTKKEIERSAVTTAESIVSSLPSNEIFKLTGSISDTTLQSYKIIKEKLSNLVEIDIFLWNACLFQKKDGELYFIVESTPHSNPDVSLPGDHYSEAQPFFFTPFNERKTVLTKAFKDRWGTWISVLVPVTNSETGEVEAVFGLDYKAEYWKNKILFEVLESSFLVLISLILFVVFRISRAKNVKLKNLVSDKNKAYVLLNDRERKLNDLIENLPGIVYQCKYDRDWTMIFISKNCFEITGYTDVSFIDNSEITFNDIIIPEYRDAIYKKWEDVIRKKEIFEFEYPIKTSSGIIKWLWERGRGVYDENDEVLFLEGYIEDITNEKTSVEELKLSESNFTRTIEESPFGIRIVLKSGETIYANQKLLDIFGFQNIENFNLVEVTSLYSDESYSEHLLRELKRNAGDKSINEYEISIKNSFNESKYLQVFRYEILWNKQISDQIIYVDITDRKNAEFELVKLKEAIEQSPVSIVITSGEGKIEYVNPKFTEITGYAPSEAIGKNPRLLNSGQMQNDFYENLWSTIKSGEIWTGELINRRKSGKEYWTKKSISSVTDRNGKIVHFVDISEDYTEKKNIEVELISAKEKAEESDRLKSSFLANISHEIRTPMNGILGFAELLKDPDLSNENQIAFLDVIEKSGQRMLNIINDLIDVSKIEAGETKIRLKPVMLRFLIEELYSFFRLDFENKKLEFNYHLDEYYNDYMIITDGNKLHQILTNLIRNSFKFTEKGKVEFGFRIANSKVVLFVSDTGFGIPKENIKFIFDRFRQGSISLSRNYEGAGLGLTITKAFVEMLGGEINIDSVLNKGTTVLVEFPFNEYENKDYFIRIDSEFNNKLQDKTILIADSDTENHLFFQKLTGNSNAKLLFVKNEIEALIQVSKLPVIDVVIIVTKLKYHEILESNKKIKSLRPELPLITLSEKPEAEDVIKEFTDELIPLKFDFKLIATILSKYLAVFIFFIFFSCTADHGSADKKSFNPKVIITEGQKFSPDRVGKPIKVKAQHNNTRVIKQLKRHESKTVVIKADNSVVKKMGIPEVATMGTDDYSLPIVIKAVIRPKIAGLPKIDKINSSQYKEINPMNFTTYNRLQGLNNDNVRGMVQDIEGNIWLCTDEGLSKFDGHRFAHFTKKQGLVEDIVLCAIQARDTSIWFGTFQGGLGRYDGKYLTNFTVDEGLPSDVVNCIIQDKEENIWIGTGKGLVKFDGTYFTVFKTENGLCNNDIRALVIDKKGNIVIGTRGKGISIFDGKAFTNISEKHGLAGDHIYRMFYDSNGNLWVGTNSKGISVFDGETFRNYTTSEGLSSDYIRSFSSDNLGNIWIGTEGGGISKCDGESFTHISLNEGLSSNVIRYSITDSNGKLWFGTRGGGVSRYDGNFFKHFSVNEGLSSNRVMNIEEDDKGNFWLAMATSGITIFYPKEDNFGPKYEYSFLTANDGLAGNYAYDIYKDSKGNIWFSSENGGVSKISENRITNYTVNEGLCDNSIRKIIDDKNGNIWFCSYGSGVSKFDGEYFVNYTEAEGLNGNAILTGFRDSKNNLWFGSNNGGLTKFDGNVFTHFGYKQGLSKTIFSITEDKKGNLWFGTSGDGLLKYDGESFTYLNEKNGLSNNYVMSLYADKYNNILIGTRVGLNILNENAFNEKIENPEKPLFKKYGFHDGFTGNTCNMGSIYVDSKGIIWIGTTTKLTTLNPANLIKKENKPKVRIKELKLFHEMLNWSELENIKDSSVVLENGIKIGKVNFSKSIPWVNLPNDLILKHSQNYLTLIFSGINEGQSHSLLYQYILQGFDKKWSELTDLEEVTYGSLPTGKYSFKVKTINNDGIWSETESFEFEIVPPWWHDWWFRITLLIIISSAIYSYILNREKRLRIEKNMLQLKVIEQTKELSEQNNLLELMNSEKDKFFSIIAHDLKGPLGTFLSLAEILDENIKDFSEKQLQDLAASMHKSSKNLYDLLGNLLEWSIMKRGITNYDPEKLNLFSVSLACQKTIEEAAQNKSLTIENNISQIIFVFADKNMISTIFRNLLTNAVKFTQNSGKIALNARLLENNEVEISITDTGIGIPTQIMNKLFVLSEKTTRLGTLGEQSNGLGLMLSKEFVEKHKGRIWVESIEDEGSTFYFTIPSLY